MASSGLAPPLFAARSLLRRSQLDFYMLALPGRQGGAIDPSRRGNEVRGVRSYTPTSELGSQRRERRRGAPGVRVSEKVVASSPRRVATIAGRRRGERRASEGCGAPRDRSPRCDDSETQRRDAAASHVRARGGGVEARFCNHSCAPSCRLQKWAVAGRARFGIFAARPLEKGDEITFDYREARWRGRSYSSYEGTQSLCDASSLATTRCVGEGAVTRVMKARNPYATRHR